MAHKAALAWHNARKEAAFFKKSRDKVCRLALPTCASSRLAAAIGTGRIDIDSTGRQRNMADGARQQHSPQRWRRRVHRPVIATATAATAAFYSFVAVYHLAVFVACGAWSFVASTPRPVAPLLTMRAAAAQRAPPSLDEGAAGLGHTWLQSVGQRLRKPSMRDWRWALTEVGTLLMIACVVESMYCMGNNSVNRALHIHFVLGFSRGFALLLIWLIVRNIRRPVPYNLSLAEQPGDTIFVSVASYRDELCPGTLRSLFERAAAPQNIYVGLCLQNAKGDAPCPADGLCIGDGTCESCGRNRHGCPGHWGHVELQMPVIHIAMVAPLLQTLRSHCPCGVQSKKKVCPCGKIKDKYGVINI